MNRGQSLVISPLFNGTNYAYQKVHIKAFLQSLDEKVWQTVEMGWTKPTEASADWDDAKIEATSFNSRALNALFSAITNEEFQKISSTKTAKEAWTIIQTTYEGTKAIKDSKLQRLTTSCEEIKIEEDESFDDKDSKKKSYITRQFKQFMKNADAKGFDKDQKQSNSLQFKSQDRGKKDAKEGGQYTVPSGPKCFGCQGFGHMK